MGAPLTERLRHHVNGPFKNGPKYTVNTITSGEELLEAADRIDVLEAALKLLIADIDTRGLEIDTAYRRAAIDALKGETA